MSGSSNVSAALAGDEAECFNMQVVSPSAGVNERLSFPRLSAMTTVKQLKEKIREALPMRPPDDHQRIIYQGRLLARDTDTMLEILGQDKLKNVDIQTLHLVLRPATSETTAPLNGPALPNRHGDALNLSLPRSSRWEPPTPPRVSPEFIRYGNDNREHERTQHERPATPHPEYPHAGTTRFPTPPAFPVPVRPPSSTLDGPPSLQSVNNQQSNHVPQPANGHSPQVARSPDPTAEQARRIAHAHHHHHHNPQPLQAMQLVVQQLQHDHERFHREYVAQQLPVRNAPGGTPQPVPRNIPSNPGQFPEGATFQELIAQNQRDRAAMGMHGAQQGNSSTNNLPNPPLVGPPQGSSSNLPIPPPTGPPLGFRTPQLPQQTRTMTHEMNGPNGERWHLTINETTTIQPPPGIPNNQAPHLVAAPMAREVQDLIQNIIRAGNGVPVPPQGRQLPGDSQPADLQSTAGTNAATNRPTSTSPSGNSNRVNNPMASTQEAPEQSAPVAGAGVNTPTLAGPEVYILSSPTGPQALLVNPAENGLEAFFTPQHRSTGFSRTENQQRQDGAAPNTQGAIERRIQRREARAQRHARLQDGPNIRPALPARPGNPQAGRVAIQLWPHIWLIIRLIIFVWFFATGENRSWYQFITVTGLAVVVFVASTGIFNGIADQVWAPFRRHLEGLVPLAAPNIADRAIPNNERAPLNNANAENTAPRQGVEAPAGGGAPNPAAADPHLAEAVARLIEQRRQLNESWLLTQLRRAEHAMILFLASLIPGVGERHIAARAAEENLLLEAERLRREVGAAAERVEAVEEQLRTAMVAAGVASLNTPGARAGQNFEEGGNQTRARTENEEGGGDENTAAGSEHGNATSQTREETPGQPLIEI